MASPLPLDTSPGVLSSDVMRRGQALLRAGLAAGLALTLLLAWQTPELVAVIPLGLVAVLTLGWLFRYPFANLTVLLAGFVLVLNSRTGLQILEVVYGLYLYAFLFHWYGERLLRSEQFVLTSLDRIAALLLIFGLGGGIVLGLLFGAPLDGLRGEALAFSMLGLYFPVKEICRRERHGAAVLVAVTVWVGLFVALRNLLNFREIILAATQAWQVADARPGLNEMQLLIPLLAVLVLLLQMHGGLRRFGLLVLFLILAGALVMTKARGYWIDFLFGFGILFLLLQGKDRWRLLTLSLIGSIATIAVTLIFFGSVADLVFSGAINRFSTLGTALSDDVSLLNRFNETSAVWARIQYNPIVGYGFGTEFSYYDWVYRYTRTTSFMHNGYTALWFKQGVWGLALMLLFWGGAAWQGIKVYRNKTLPQLHRVLALGAAVTLIAIIPSAGTSNPFILSEQVYTLALQLGLACGLYQRYFVHTRASYRDDPPLVKAAVPRQAS